MPFKAVISDLTSVDEAHRGLYRKVEDPASPANGKFILDVEPVEGFDLAPVSNLLSALREERERSERAERQAKAWEGLNPDEVKKRLEREERLSKIDPTKEADRLATEKVEAYKSTAQAEIAALKAKSETREKSLLDQIRNLLLTSQAQAMIAKHKGNATVLLPHVTSRARVREKDDGTFVVEVLDERGGVRIKDASGAAFSIEDLVVEMRGTKDFGVLFATDGTTGSESSRGTPGSISTTKNPWKKDSFNLTEQMRLQRTDPARAKALMAEAGVA